MRHRRRGLRRQRERAGLRRPLRQDGGRARYKGIDIIVNNAGYTWDDVIQKMTDEQWYAIIDCHLTAPFRILRAAYPRHQGAARRPTRKRASRCIARSSTSRRPRRSTAMPAR